MRKAQNVVKFGLKLGAFAALTAALSSCVISITDNSGPPTVSNVRVQSTYCSATSTATDVTNLDFKFDYTGNVDIDRVESAWVVIPVAKTDAGDNTFDSSVTNPLIPGAGFKVRSSIGSGTLFNFVSGSTYKGTLRLTMGDGVGDSTVPADLETIKAQAIVLNGPGRLWVRGITKAGANTEWAKATNLTLPAARDSGPCDGNI